MLKRIKGMAPLAIIVIALIAALILILFFRSIYNGAQMTGNALGTSAGETVGTAIGTYYGVTQDYREGWNEGKTQGLSADDTEVTDIFGIIQETGNLQVLVAGVTIDVAHEVGDKYAAIYLLRGEAIFTVNLGEAVINVEQNIVMLPLPEVSLTVDETEIEKIAEWQATFFNGSTEDGYSAYMNSIDQSKKNAEEAIANYDELLTLAQEAAKNQVQRLVSNMTGKNISVQFFMGGE